MGIIYLDENRCEEAIGCFESAIKCSPNGKFPVARFSLGSTFLIMKKFDLALDAYSRLFFIINY